MIIIKAPDPILNQVCSEIGWPTHPEMVELANNMISTMLANKGKGLAAPQVGYTVRMFCMIYGRIVLTLINPKIIRRGREMVKDVEGCLSLPGQQVMVSRHKIITVRFTDLQGNTQTYKMRGIDARCIQHEMDHLEGILIA